MIDCGFIGFYHSEKLQSTKTMGRRAQDSLLFYHSEKLQSTKTATVAFYRVQLFYHSEKLQSTKTINDVQSVAG